LIDGIKFKFPGIKENLYTFNIRESLNNPVPEPISLQHEIIQTILKEAIPYTDSQQIPVIKMKQGNSVSGYWSLWHLEVKNRFESNQVIIPIFVSIEGDNFTAFAQMVWDKLVQENNNFERLGMLSEVESKHIVTDISAKAEELLQVKFEEYETSINQNTETIKQNKERSFSFLEKQMNRIGIDNIRQSRLVRLAKEKEQWENSFDSAKQIVPSLTCLLLLKITNG